MIGITDACHWFSVLLLSSLGLKVLGFHSSESNFGRYLQSDGTNSDNFCSSQLLSQLGDAAISTKIDDYRSCKRKTRKKKLRRKKHRLTTDSSKSESILGKKNEDSNSAKLDQHPTLVLNADYTPISYLPLSKWHWQATIKSIFSGKVTVVDVYPEVVVRASHLEVPLPSVIALNDYQKMPNVKAAFTRRNVYLRDEFRCQYCLRKFDSRELTLDHVLPRCMGGQLCWENTVTCCTKCNGRKGCLTVNELKAVGMKLNKQPVAPTQHQLHQIAGKIIPKKIHPSWSPYL